MKLAAEEPKSGLQGFYTELAFFGIFSDGRLYAAGQHY
jgi:hypothetical protein